MSTGDYVISTKLGRFDKFTLLMAALSLGACLTWSFGSQVTEQQTTNKLETRLSELEHRYNYWFPTIDPCIACHKTATRKVKH